ncbi:methyl-accepting chemotaxis protein [Fundidesulfovibrio terrae]|uniref:methyl-accepting chemotaxis protein n=1 Tax=Fundidesulfovibrio terrae TaxID=2922866 RepID=UPI001FB00464|nr:methyl-accepting chemotaxis protein [Fundidesulfovibrio terrae]
MTRSLQLKFLIPALGAVVLGMACLVLLNARTVRSSMEAQLAQDMSLLAQSLTRDVTGSMEDKFILLDGVAAKENVIMSASIAVTSTMQPELSSLAKSVKGLLYFNVFDLTGEAQVSSEILKAPINVTDRDYFKAVVDGGVAHAVSKPLISRTVGKAVAVLAVPIRDKSKKLVGVLNAGLDLDYLVSEVSKTKIGDTGYVFILDRDGMYVAHPDPAKRMKNVENPPEWLRRAMQAKSLEQIAFEEDGKPGMATVMPDPLTGWRFVVMAPAQELAAQVSRVNGQNMAIAAGVALALVGVIVVVLRVLVLRPLFACGGFARDIAAGKLDSALAVRDADEIGRMADDMRSMVDALRESLEQARQEHAMAEKAAAEGRTALAEAEQARRQAESAKSEGMMQAVAVLRDVVEGLQAGSRGLMDEIDSLREGVQGQESVTSETAAAMDEMNSSALEVARNANEASELAGRTRAEAQRGQSVVDDARRAITQVDELAKALEQGMTRLGDQAKAIGQVMDVISDIADQTNLLALNAAIEAARAGEAGRGFAVVADEVRKLAEKTMNSTKEVGQAISSIQAGTAQNVDMVNKAAQAVEVASGLAAQSGEALLGIVDLVDKTSGQVSGIAQAAGQQSSVSEEIARSVSGISSFSQDLGRGMDDFTRTVSGMAGHVDELSRVISGLERQAGSGGPAQLKA